MMHVLESGAPRRTGDRPAPSTTSRDEDARPGDLLCATCGRRITHEDHRIEVGGAHEHTFVNPGGFVHLVGCFAFASGLSYVGPPETAFSWFPGWSWQIAACLTCRTHLGWLFRCAGDQFHGLLTAQLVRR
jgi:hypothetical protein